MWSEGTNDKSSMSKFSLLLLPQLVSQLPFLVINDNCVLHIYILYLLGRPLKVSNDPRMRNRLLQLKSDDRRCDGIRWFVERNRFGKFGCQVAEAPIRLFFPIEPSVQWLSEVADCAAKI